MKEITVLEYIYSEDSKGVPVARVHHTNVAEVRDVLCSIMQANKIDPDNPDAVDDTVDILRGDIVVDASTILTNSNWEEYL